jgi:hypothetical protein
MSLIRRVTAASVACLVASVLSVGLFVGVVFGCHAQSPTPQTARAIAADTVQAFNTAWGLSSVACYTVAQTQGSEATRQKCVAVLTPAYESIVSAALAVDAFTDATSGASIGCVLSDVSGLMQSVESLLIQLQVAVPPALTQGLALAESLIPQCVRDAGPAGEN